MYFSTHVGRGWIGLDGDGERGCWLFSLANRPINLDTLAVMQVVMDDSGAGKTAVVSTSYNDKFHGRHVST